MSQRFLLEVYQLALAQNITVNYDHPVEYIAAFGGKMPGARPSMLLDHHAKRRSEIDAFNGMVVELGSELGIPMPYNEVLTAIILQRETGF